MKVTFLKIDWVFPFLVKKQRDIFSKEEQNTNSNTAGWKRQEKKGTEHKNRRQEGRTKEREGETDLKIHSFII